MDTNFEKRKLNKNFKICVICLIVAVFMSLMLFMGTMNIRSEIQSEKMVGVFVAIYFSCAFIIPPLVCLIVLIYRKEIFFNIEQERIKALKKYESSDLKKINNYVEQLLVNDKLMIILKNYVLTHSISGWELELACLPLRETFLFQTGQTKNKRHFMLDKWDKYFNETSTYIDFVKNFNNDILEENNENVEAAYILRDNLNSYQYIESINSQFKEMQDLYITLQHQNIIDIVDDKLFYYAFLFLIYREDNKKFYEQAVKRLEDNDIKLDANNNEIIKKLYDNDFE